MGSTFRLPIARAAVEEGLAAARAAGWRLVATVPRDGTALNQLPFDRSTLLLLGNEGAGLPDAVQRHTTAQLTIPMRTGVESLNVATTAALVLYEAQRRRAGARP
jgi:tRNA G18 (ribose-2'-O)-methylase SpoU